MSALLPAECSQEESMLDEAYARYAQILNKPKNLLISEALQAYLEELQDASIFLKGRQKRLSGEKGFSMEEIKKIHHL